MSNMYNPLWANNTAELARKSCAHVGVLAAEKEKLDREDVEGVLGAFGGKIVEDDVGKQPFFVKTSDATFTVFLPAFSAQDALCALGRVFVDFKDIQEGEPIYIHERSSKGMAARTFAMAFLMPKKLFTTVVVKNSNSDIEYNVDAVAETFGVSVNDAVARGKELEI